MKLYRSYLCSITNRDQSYYIRTGEYRVPVKGEFFLSGAIVEVYKATGKENKNLPIAEKIPDPPKYIYSNGLRYKLDPELGD